MNRSMHRWRLPLFCCFSVVASLTIVFFFLPWRFVIPGYRFPYHGIPSLIAATMALLVGLLGTIRNWRRPTVNWPWLVAIAILVVQTSILIAFLRGPDIAVGKGTAAAPWGDAPIEMQFDIRPLWGVYAAIISSLASLVLSMLSLLANRINAEPSEAPKSPIGREFES